MKKELLFIGTGYVGGFLAHNYEKFNPDFRILGFLDVNPEKPKKEFFGYEVFGDIDCLRNFPKGISVLVGIANPVTKKKVVERINKYEPTFVSFIHERAWISQGVTLGKGVIIYPGVSINYASTIGDFATINMNCAIGHHCTISSFCALAPGVSLAGFTYLEESVDFGIGACSIQKVHVGEGAVIGGQGMLIRDVASQAKVVGVPARQIN